MMAAPHSPACFRKGFTLLELLLAVAVLAVLALLTLSGIRMYREKSNEIVCVAKLRAIGAAIPLYAGERGGYLPVAKDSKILVNSPNYGTWAVALMPYMSNMALTNNRTTNSRLIQEYAELFRCPSDKAFQKDYDHTWSYGWNMACGNTPDGLPGTTDYPKIKLAAFHRPSEVFVVADAYHNSSGYNFGNAGTDWNANTPASDAPGSHLRHPPPHQRLTEAEVTQGIPRRNILHLDGHIAKRLITTNDTWRPLMQARGLID